MSRRSRSASAGRSATWTDRRGTVWKLAWIPLGGYVKLHGQERPEEVAADVRALWIPGKTFHEKQVGSRAIVVAAGPIANFILAAVLFAALFATAGRLIPIPVVGEVIANSAASRAGLQTGDRVTDIDGTPIKRFEDIQRIVVSHPGVALTMRVHRGDADQTLSRSRPDSQAGSGGRVTGMLGIRGGNTEFERLSPWQAVPRASRRPGKSRCRR